MRVNFSFSSLFTNRLVVRPRIPIVIGIAMLTILFIASSFTEPSDRNVRATQVNLIIRQIGDQLLLRSGDSTSRVLPVTEIKAGTFLLEFENEFGFKHDSLMVLSMRLLNKTEFPSGYTVTVHDCTKAGIVYGFQLNNNSPDILACRGRSEPLGCYKIEFTFHDLYENVEHKKADIVQLNEERKSSKVDLHEANPIPTAIGTEEFKTTATYDTDPLTEGLTSFNDDSQKANPIPIIGIEEAKTTNSDYALNNVVYGGMLVLLGVALVIGRFGKIFTPLSVQNQNHTTIKEQVPELPALGKFSFDVKDQRLLLGSDVISLTDKEYKILELLNRNFGELIPRETLMQEVWINEGIITGRSLDMFVSKLRKKLSSDPELRITNVHGKGYKLEISGIQN